MLMPKNNKIAIYEYLFKEGVMVAKKDPTIPRHPCLNSVTNLQIIVTMRSLASRGLVKEQFAWRHYYWYLTNEGIAFLRNFLCLPAEIVPATLKRKGNESRGGAAGAGTGGPGAGTGAGGPGGVGGGAPDPKFKGYGRGKPISE
ncbi:40S ribosomal protein S10-like [Panonychus citri]|uniref:40S ribosomal protein S10-like n=1 Tax=Panonychus citri TaxID=50023 RepID=UPI002307AA70|nr:40S ribosomal protein S10-like [Panonychus citri]